MFQNRKRCSETENHRKNSILSMFFLSFLSRGTSRDGTGQAVKIPSRPVAKFWAFLLVLATCRLPISYLTGQMDRSFFIVPGQRNNGTRSNLSMRRAGIEFWHFATRWGETGFWKFVPSRPSRLLKNCFLADKETPPDNFVVVIGTIVGTHAKYKM